ncbi:MAG: VCBS repeat-containing protein [Polyangiaceae bacterium]|nr:VCBS repeat-containing protein [Polyangiaceae bacterium]
MRSGVVIWAAAGSFLLACTDGGSATSGGGAGASGAGAATSGGSGGGGGSGGAGASSGLGGGGGVEPPPASCEAEPGGGSAATAAPVLLLTLKDRWEEGWLGSPAVADLDGDGSMEIIAPRGEALLVWNADGTLRRKVDGFAGRIWASPVVADFLGDARLEIGVASRDTVTLLDADGDPLPGFPVTWRDELRSLAAGDVDGDGSLDLIAALADGGPSDVVNAWRANGSPVAGFPPNASGASGCEQAGGASACYLAGCYDQNLAVGDLDGDGRHDVVAPHDNAYASFHRGTGEAFDAASGFAQSKAPGVRYLHELAEARQGWAEDEDTALQAHFTNTAPALADLDGDGASEIVLVASVQNAAQSEREWGVAVWVVRPDVSRLPAWTTPFRAPDYLGGLWDYGDNVVAITNQATIADLDPTRAGPEILFAGFDGRVHAVSAEAEALWSFQYTTSPTAGTGGIVVADLSGDGSPEIVFASYASADDTSALFVLDAGGNLQHRVPLPRRGAMPVPTIADVDGDGALEIVVSLKDAEDREESVLVYSVPGSGLRCLPWPTARGNLLRNAWSR